MSGQDEEYLRVVEEYKNFDIDGFKREVMDSFDKEVNTLNSKEAGQKGEGIKRIQQYERLHEDHQNLQKENIEAGDGRKKVLENIQKDTIEFDTFAKTAIKEKKGFRDNISDLEDSLRKLNDQLSNLVLDNKNLQLVVDTEGALRNAKANAEVVSVTSVNNDLKTQVARINQNISEEQQKRGEAKRVLEDLTKKHGEAVKKYEALLAEIEKEKKKAESDLDGA